MVLHWSAIQHIQLTILDRYKQNARILPRRMTNDPYQVLVSETMLCQTQVKRVVSYFELFLTQFPTIQSLAHSDKKTLLLSWSWLGYNSRVLRLKQCCQIICNEHYGIIPSDYDQLIALPGIWDYIASAVLCFAYQQDVAVVDTNVRRVLIHELWLSQDINHSMLKKIAWQTIPIGNSRVRRNAIMDYGALVLTSKKTKIAPKTKQSPFLWSTRQIRSMILKYLLHHPYIAVNEVINTYPHPKIIIIIDKMIQEWIIYRINNY